MGRQGTWEILLLPAGKDAGKGIASMKIQTPVRRRTCTAAGAPMADTNSTGTRGAGWRKQYLIPTQAKRNLSSRSGIGGVLSAT